ncbi:MAG: endonuclease/exonuclease/phosphatase family protein [Treponemataceae bacterium]|nr:endonuclease/exonuclease/phosphatase family protein [Treponemataceae bacterium]
MKTKIKTFAMMLALATCAAFVALCFATLFGGCADAREGKHASLKIVNWNAQTFFDANNDGIEYSNFQKSKKWGEAAYKERLKKLCRAIKVLDGDVVILEEIENEGILHDISNALAGENWNPKKVYRYGCFSKKKNSSIGCAVISRHELCGFKIHSLDVRAENSRAPSMRPLMEVDLLVAKNKFSSGKKSRALKIFVNHWKSKSGGEEESKIWRRWQEGLLAQKISDAQNDASLPAIICAGDFNQDISEFNFIDIETIKSEDFCNAPNIEFAMFDSREKILVYSPWPEFSGEEGSYFFRDKWERIDHFFACGQIALKEFSPQTSGAWAYEYGRPKPFKIYSLNGYSDHLPISCVVEF